MINFSEAPATKPNDWRGRNPLCEGEMSDEHKKYSKRLGKVAQCSFQAAFIINGKGYCERHAGKLLIKLHLELRCSRLHCWFYSTGD